MTIIDAHGCTTSQNMVVNNSTPVIDSSSVQNVVCHNSNNGAITVHVSQGNPTYSYVWSNGDSGNTANELGAGNYQVQVSDINGCTTTANFSITEPEALQVNAVIEADLGNNEGQIKLNLNGGTPGYTFMWSNGATTQNIGELSAGIYSVTITDANGCTTEMEFEVLNESTANSSVVTDVSLVIYPNPSDGDVKIKWKGTGAQLIIVNQLGSVVLVKKVLNTQLHEVLDLEAGIYTVKIIGVNGSTAARQLVIF